MRAAAAAQGESTGPSSVDWNAVLKQEEEEEASARTPSTTHYDSPAATDPPTVCYGCGNPREGCTCEVYFCANRVCGNRVIAEGFVCDECQQRATGGTTESDDEESHVDPVMESMADLRASRLAGAPITGRYSFAKIVFCCRAARGVACGFVDETSGNCRFEHVLTKHERMMLAEGACLICDKMRAGKTSGPAGTCEYHGSLLDL